MEKYDFVLLTDAIAGHDVMDSTTVTDPLQIFSLSDDISVKNLHIGIPKVHAIQELLLC